MKATIYVKTDNTRDMANVYTRIGSLPQGMERYDFGMEGNTRDFHPGCHGMHQFGDFRGANSLAIAMQEFLTKRGYTVKIVRGTYKYRY